MQRIAEAAREDRRRPRDRRARRGQRARRPRGSAGVGPRRRRRRRSSNATAASAATSRRWASRASPGTGTKRPIDSEGIGIEFEERAKAMGAAMPEPQSISHALDAEMFKYVADVLVQEAGRAADAASAVRRADPAGWRDRGVITESKAGREAILARRVVDATGDADVVARAGAPVAQDAARGNDVRVGDVLDDGRQQAALHRRREGRSADLPRLDGQRRVEHRDHAARRTSSSRRSCASRSSRRSRRASSRRRSRRSPAPGAR